MASGIFLQTLDWEREVNLLLHRAELPSAFFQRTWISLSLSSPIYAWMLSTMPHIHRDNANIFKAGHASLPDTCVNCVHNSHKIHVHICRQSNISRQLKSAQSNLVSESAANPNAKSCLSSSTFLVFWVSPKRLSPNSTITISTDWPWGLAIGKIPKHPCMQHGCVHISYVCKYIDSLNRVGVWMFSWQIHVQMPVHGVNNYINHKITWESGNLIDYSHGKGGGKKNLIYMEAFKFWNQPPHWLSFGLVESIIRSTIACLSKIILKIRKN